MIKKVLLFLLLYTYVNGAYSQEIKGINQLFKEFDNNNSPGAAIIVVKNGEIIHSNACGIANLEYNIPITQNTVFHIGSVSKQFTAFAILLLEEQGKLALEDRITKYLDDLHDSMNDIEIKNLLHHTSGLREIETLQQICGITTADQIDSDDLYRLIRNQKNLNFIPGDEIEYTNTGYFLLAKIVEKVTGMSFKNWTSENIFLPLNMNSTEFYDDCTVIVKNRAYPYWIYNGELIKGILSYSYVGPTSVMTTSEDMSKWIVNFSKNTVGNENIIHRMLTETDTLNSGEKIDYGFGLGLTSYKNLDVVLHSGHDAAYRAATLYFPKYKTGIVILSNYFNIDPMQYGFKISDLLFKDHIIETGSKENEEDEGEYTPESDIKPQTLSTERLSEYAGTYMCRELGIQYFFRIQQENLVAEFWRNATIELEPAGQDTFRGNQYWFKDVSFIRSDSKKVKGFYLSSGRVRDLWFEKISDYNEK